MSLTSLDGLPRPVQILRGCLAHCPTTGPHLGLDLREATGELVSSLAQAILGVDVPKPGHVHDREQHVSELFAHALGTAPLELVTHLCELLVELAPRVLPAWPVEAHAS